MRVGDQLLTALGIVESRVRSSRTTPEAWAHSSIPASGCGASRNAFSIEFDEAARKRGLRCRRADCIRADSWRLIG